MKRLPDQSTPRATATPIVYVREKTVWEYKRVTRDLLENNVPTEEELNQFGKDGWELVSILANSGSLHLYFKRLKD